MKKILIIVITTVFVFSLFGCSTKNKTINQGTASSTGKKVVYKDGVYDVKHKSTKPGYEEAVVTIKNKNIQNIVLKRLDDSKKEVNYNDWNGTKGYPNLKKYRLDLAKAMMNKKSPDVNVISGATQSSNGWKAAVSSALSKAQ
jgi:uncharacterized protein with FMN-binding domain